MTLPGSAARMRSNSGAAVAYRSLANSREAASRSAYRCVISTARGASGRAGGAEPCEAM